MGSWSDDNWFDVVAEDHGGQAPDFYHFTIRKIPGAVIYETSGDLVGGKIQIHPPDKGHPATLFSLPPWVSLEP